MLEIIAAGFKAIILCSAFPILRSNKSVGSVKSMEKSDIFTAGSIIPGQ